MTSGRRPGSRADVVSGGVAGLLLSVVYTWVLYQVSSVDLVVGPLLTGSAIGGVLAAGAAAWRWSDKRALRLRPGSSRAQLELVGLGAGIGVGCLTILVGLFVLAVVVLSG